MAGNGKRGGVREPIWYDKDGKRYDQSGGVGQSQAWSNTSYTPQSSTTTDQSDVKFPELEDEIMLNQEVYKIKGDFFCQNQHLLAIEAPKKRMGYDNACPLCQHRHIMLAQGRGYYALADKIYEALQTQKREQEYARGPPPLAQLKHFTGFYPPLDKILAGQNKGIEGDSNSCYMDATIFCMFAYNDVFDSLLYQKTNKDMAPLQEILRDYVVHVLRTPDGFVRRHAMYYLRLELCKATGDQSFVDKEKDPSEFLKAFEKTFGFEPIKTIHPSDTPRSNWSNVTNNIVWEMFDMNPQALLSTSIGQMFQNSLAEIPARLLTVPPVLILIAPRHERGKRSYPYIVPDRQIVLDNDSLQLFCTKCKKTNSRSEAPIDFYACDKCQRDVQQRSTDAMIECYCSGCLKEKHENSGSSARYDHSVKKVEAKKHKLDLFAVLCIQTSHYVAFVKCKTQQGGAEWLFFDSMSDRINNQTNIPSVTRVRDFENWLDEPTRNKYFFEDLERTVRDSRPTSQKFSEDEMRRLRLFRDGAFFFYENSTANYQ